MANLLDLLRCPRCGSTFEREDGLICAKGHTYPVVDGIPRLVEIAWSGEQGAIVKASANAFGEQWLSLGGDAEVSKSDLLLHLPDGWGVDRLVGTVLDAGCGMGRYAALVAGEGARVVGLDVSRAVELGAVMFLDVEFIQADIAAPPFESDTFDLVYSFGVLHHLPDPQRGVNSCFDLVRPGGNFLAWVYGDHGGLLRRGRRVARAAVALAPFLRVPTAASAAVVLFGYVQLARRVRPGRGPIRFHQDKGFRQLYVDCHDALAAPHERYVTRAEALSWLRALTAEETGVEPRRDGSGWVLWARKPAT